MRIAAVQNRSNREGNHELVLLRRVQVPRDSLAHLAVSKALLVARTE
jgi:hypothetical protein